MTGSLFDIIGPVMVGPSSSHTAGAVRLANLAKLIAVREVQKVEFILYNSFAHTYKGHGTDRGLLAGVLGYGVDDERIREAFELAEMAKLDYQFTPFEGKNSYPPNTVKFKLTVAPTKSGDKPEEMTIIGHSIGGGKVYVSKINDFNVSLKGELPTIVMYYKDQPGMIWKTTKVMAERHINIATLNCARSGKGGTAFMTITLDALPDASDIEAIAAIEDVSFVRCIAALPSFSEV